jgi:FkbM family methyltransferase
MTKQPAVHQGFMNSLADRLRESCTRRIRKFARNRKSKIARYIDGLAVEFHRNFENWNYRFSSNGESRVLDCLSADCGIKMIFDVGANQGTWALMAIEKFPQATVHAFELSPPTAGLLLANVAEQPKIFPNAHGMSDANKEIEFFYAPNWNTLSSGVAVTGTTPTEKMLGRVVRGADYCQEKAIEIIDFLKMDVEGMEDLVLKGFRELLERKAIRVIQFEYGRVNIESHFLLKDFYTVLTAYGYVVGKIYPNEVLFKEYAYTDEDFLGPNYLAVLRSETALIERISG